MNVAHNVMGITHTKRCAMLYIDDRAEEAEAKNGISALEVFAGRVYVIDSLSRNQLSLDCFPVALLVFHARCCHSDLVILCTFQM